MKTIIDYTGQKIGEWTVMEQVTEKSPIKYRCKCSCGTERIIPKGDLARGRTYHCGCKKYDLDSPYHDKKIPDLRGQKYRRLTPVEYVCVDGTRVWRCICDCGNEKYTTSALLRSGGVQSCGCYKADAGKLNAKKARANTSIAYGRM